jgi:hypothetical protein
MDVSDLLHIDRYLANDGNDGSTQLKGLNGSPVGAIDAIMKYEAAKVKHSNRFRELTAKQKNFIALSGVFIRAAQSKDIPLMSDTWEKQVHSKKPWDFNRIYIIGSMLYSTGGHAVLWVLNFGKKNTIDWYDSGHEDHTEVAEQIRDWLIDEQEFPEEREISFVDHKDEVPFQVDLFNCAQYALLTARALMQGRKLDYTGFVEPLSEFDTVNYRYSTYKHGRRNWFGMRVHPETDKVVERFSKIKERDGRRMKRWKTKQMKGFK